MGREDLTKTISSGLKLLKPTQTKVSPVDAKSDNDTEGAWPYQDWHLVRFQQLVLWHHAEGNGPHMDDACDLQQQEQDGADHCHCSDYWQLKHTYRR